MKQFGLCARLSHIQRASFLSWELNPDLMYPKRLPPPGPRSARMTPIVIILMLFLFPDLLVHLLVPAWMYMAVSSLVIVKIASPTSDKVFLCEARRQRGWERREKAKNVTGGYASVWKTTRWEKKILSWWLWLGHRECVLRRWSGFVETESVRCAWLSLFCTCCGWIWIDLAVRCWCKM